MLTREEILKGRYRRQLSQTAAEYGIALRVSQQLWIPDENLTNSVLPEEAVYERLADQVWHNIYGELLGPVHELVKVAHHTQRHGDHTADRAAQRVLDLLRYR